MTREELREEIDALTLSVCGDRRSEGLTVDIMALLDRYEREQWSKDDPGRPWDRPIVFGYIGETVSHIIAAGDWPLNADRPEARWRALPPGPEGGK